MLYNPCPQSFRPSYGDFWPYIRGEVPRKLVQHRVPAAFAALELRLPVRKQLSLVTAGGLTAPAFPQTSWSTALLRGKVNHFSVTRVLNKFLV